MRLLAGDLVRLGGQVLVRSRFAEDLLEQAVAAGATQYVLLGAGFDFNARSEYAPDVDQRTLEKYRRATARRGEPVLSSVDPEDFLGQVCGLGFGLVESLSPAEQEQRYLANRPDGLRTIPTSILAHLRRLG